MRKLFLLFISSLIVAALLSACGKSPSLGESNTPAQQTVVPGLEIVVSAADKTSVTYTVTNNSDTGFCYEGHAFGILEKNEAGTWKALQLRDDLMMTRDFQYCEITPDAPATTTIDIDATYGGKLAKGQYRVVVKGYPTIDDLLDGNQEKEMVIWGEFEIK